ncbi:putative ribonuclease H-like domain-containing protein [Tanacetum coccineum]|uniref:Ribonuclease H-like domain-containing protein n=1 Tax=Tanacetum coccineum TaxID=301880 RepID=A0ABQ5CEY2_9ASTR
MKAVSSPMVAAAKLLVLNLDSPPPKRIVDGVEQTYPPTTAEEKLARKNELKARGTLLMALPNEHQLKFNTYKCAKTLMEAIEKKFGGNKESKKTQKTLLKQQYENFNGSSSEGLDQTYDRLQKLISQLKILGETISQEDMNLMFLRSLPSEWKTHTLIWRNKSDLDTLSMDDLYNNLKIYETEDKCSTQAYGSDSVNTDSMSDAVIYYFFANQSNSPELNDEDLQQIDADDLEEMDLKWQMAMLTMRARRFLNKTGRKINANGSETIGFNKSKVECYNCHKKGYFARECMAPRENRNKEPIRRNVTVKTIETKSLVAQDRLSSSSSDSEVSTCSKACLKSYETLKEHYDNLTKDFNKSQLNVGAYKAGLESVEARLDVYKKNEVVFEEDIKILKLDIKLRDNALTELRKKFEKAKKDRYDLKLTLEKFRNSSKNLSKLLEIQVSDKLKTGVGFDSQVFDSQENDRYKTSEGYHAVPPPYTGNFMPPKYDLVLADEGEYVFSESVTSIPDVVTSKAKTSVSKPKYVGEPLVENWISNSKDENETEFKSKQRKPSFSKTEFVKSNKHVKTPRESFKKGNPQLELQEKGVIDSGYSRHMTRNKSYLLDYEEIHGGYYELKFNLFSVSQMCDKKNSVLFTYNKCVVLSPDFKLLDENHVLLRVPRKDNMYSVDLKNIVPSRGLTSLFAKATLDESNLWHRRLGHINFKTMNKLVRGNLVRGLPSKIFENNHTCVACQKGKQHKASCKFDRKVDEGFFVGYSTNSKALRVFNSKTRIVEENLHVKFSEDTPNIAGSGPNWLFDIHAVTKSINYEPVVAGNQSNVQRILLMLDPKPSGEEEKKDAKDPENKDISLIVNAADKENNAAGENIVYGCDDDPNMPNLEEIVYSDDNEGVDAKADMTNLDTHILVSPTPTTKIHKDHPIEQIIGDIHSTPQTKRMTKNDRLGWVSLRDTLPESYGKLNDERFCSRGLARIEAIQAVLSPMPHSKTLLYNNGGRGNFLYGKIEEEVYVYQPPGFEDLEFLNKVYKVEKALYGLQVTQKDDGIFISQDKYVDEILKKFDFSTVKITSTLMETSKPLLKDVEAADVDTHQLTLESLYTSDYAGSSLDRKSTTESSGPIPLVVDETVIKEWEDKMERAATTTSSLEAEQDNDTILRGVKAQIRFEAASKQSNDPPLSRVNTLGSKEDIMKLKELIEFCTKLSERALDL